MGKPSRPLFLIPSQHFLFNLTMLRESINKQLLKYIGSIITEHYGNPIIIIGMHRSGTSLFSRILRNYGGYFGAKLEQNSEPPCFIEANNLILSQYQSSWDRISTSLESNIFDTPAPYSILLQLAPYLSEEFFFLADQKGNEIDHPIPTPIPNRKNIELYFFPFKIKYKIAKIPPPLFWGWKDPRNTLTLRSWLSIFPNASVVHVVRNGIDASLSLWRRAHKYGDGAPLCHDIKYCFHLWEKYVEIGESWKNQNLASYYTIKYEDLLRSPQETLASIEKIFNTSPGNENTKITKIINSDRIRHENWEEYPELLEVAHQSHIFRRLYPEFVEITQEISQKQA